MPTRFLKRIDAAIHAADAELAFICEPLADALKALEGATVDMRRSTTTSPDDAAFGSTDYLHAFALTWLGHNWLRMVQAVKSHPDPRFAAAKRATAEYFATRVLTSVPTLCANAVRPAASLMALPAEAL
ncbi:MAG: acyl-CoA dehydrogenase C-terminal domain-containing protein [Panacagrimonas sp.]